MNKFIYMVAADEFYKKINPIVNTFYESYTTEFGQRIIEADHIDSKPNK